MGETEPIVGQECNNCQTKIFPRRSFCPICRKTDFTDWELPTTGKVFSFTTVNFPLDSYDQPPYYIGLILLTNTEHTLVTARLYGSNAGKLSIGQEVKLTQTTFPETSNVKLLLALPITSSTTNL